MEGLALARKLLPELIICDIAMPEMDGYSVLQALSSDTGTATIPFIFLTAKADPKDLRKGMELGADDYLFKPFTMADLVKSVEVRLLKAERLRQQVKKDIDTVPENEEPERKRVTADSSILVMTNNRPETIKVSHIKYISSDEHYSEIVCSDKKPLLVRRQLKEWEDILPPEQFIRIHRKTIINLEFVVRFEKWFNNSFRVYLKEVNEPFEVSRRFGMKLREKIRKGI